jgi:hypothetical protein
MARRYGGLRLLVPVPHGHCKVTTLVAGLRCGGITAPFRLRLCHLTGRGFEFAIERAVFASVLRRLLVSGSDRSCEKWMGDYRIAGIKAARRQRAGVDRRDLPA